MKKIYVLLIALLIMGQFNLQAQDKTNTQAATIKPMKSKISFAGLSGGEVTSRMLIANPRLVCGDTSQMISSFVFYASRKDKDPISISGTSDVLTEDMLSTLNTMNTGDKIIFEKILLKDKAGKMISGSSLAFQIK